MRSFNLRFCVYVTDKLAIFSGTYPLIHCHPLSFYSLFSSIFFGPYLSHITRETCNVSESTNKLMFLFKGKIRFYLCSFEAAYLICESLHFHCSRGHLAVLLRQHLSDQRLDIEEEDVTLGVFRVGAETVDHKRKSSTLFLNLEEIQWNEITQ